MRENTLCSFLQFVADEDGIPIVDRLNKKISKLEDLFKNFELVKVDPLTKLDLEPDVKKREEIALAKSI